MKKMKTDKEEVFSALIEFEESWKLPGALYEALKDQEKVLIVATSGYKKILCFPTRSKDVYRVK
ncbi:MAG: hypothetical protein ACTSU5_00175, partial [Promethearchaeota archaeon]